MLEALREGLIDEVRPVWGKWTMFTDGRRFWKMQSNRHYLTLGNHTVMDASTTLADEFGSSILESALDSFGCRRPDYSGQGYSRV